MTIQRICMCAHTYIYVFLHASFLFVYVTANAYMCLWACVCAFGCVWVCVCLCMHVHIKKDPSPKACVLWGLGLKTLGAVFLNPTLVWIDGFVCRGILLHIPSGSYSSELLRTAMIFCDWIRIIWNKLVQLTGAICRITEDLQHDHSPDGTTSDLQWRLYDFQSSQYWLPKVKLYGSRMVTPICLEQSSIVLALGSKLY